MADEDEIDIVGDFSFNSCFAQNNQGIPSCSDREDTVHPQWLLDSTATNWFRDGPSRKLTGNNGSKQPISEIHTTWSQEEREILRKEMEKYGRNVLKISQTLKSKSVAEIQALIEAEHGVNLDTPIFGLTKNDEFENIPAVVQEEVVLDEMSNIRDTLNLVTTAHPTVTVPKIRRRNYNIKSTKSLLKPNILEPDLIAINPSEILYEDELVVGSTESIGVESDVIDSVSKSLSKRVKSKVKGGKKIGNHRRKVSRNYDRGQTRNKNKELVKSPLGRQRIDSGVSEEKSPKMQLVLGSGLALPVSEGEQIIKIEKKKDSDPESDIEIDIDSDKEEHCDLKIANTSQTSALEVKNEPPVAVPIRRFEPMPKRKKKLNLDGGGGCTIMHTEAGDLYEMSAEPRKERAPKKEVIDLIRCPFYDAETPAPCEVSLNVSALIAMDAHAHTSQSEVMGLLGGEYSMVGDTPHLLIAAYRPADAANARTHCDMDPVSQAVAAEQLRALGLAVCGWHHSHPAFPAFPSELDLRTQESLQNALERESGRPFVAIITSQQWLPGRTASHYTCVRVERGGGRRLRVALRQDLHDLRQLRQLRLHTTTHPTHKLISSVSHHLRSAGYEQHDQVAAIQHLFS